MIKYDYVIRRNEGDITREYKPQLIPTELDDISYIQGPNSSGKSTLLNLIALSFFAEKLQNEELNSSLREKIILLRNSSHQQITFSIELSNKKLGVTLKSVKSDYLSKDIIVELITNGQKQIISYLDFQKKFRLIYDIPSDPLRRLPELLRELKQSQRNIENDIANLRRKIESIIKEIQHEKDPQYLKKLKTQIHDYEFDKSNTVKKIESAKKILLWLETFRCLKFFYYYDKLIVNIKDDIEKKKKLLVHEGNKKKKLSIHEKEIMFRLQSRISRSKEIQEQSFLLLDHLVQKEDRPRLELWQKIDCEEELRNPHIKKELHTEVQYFLKLLNSIEESDDKNSLGEVKLLNALLDLLNQFKGSNLMVPGTDKNVTDFIDILNSEIKKREKIVNKSENIKNSRNLLRELFNIITQVTSEDKEIKALLKQNEESGKLDNSQFIAEALSDLNKRKLAVERKLKMYQDEMGRMSISLVQGEKKLHHLKSDLINYESYDPYSEDQITQKILDIEIEIDSKSKYLIKLEKEIDLKTDEVERLEKKAPHKYENNYKSLHRSFVVIQELERKFSMDFSENISKIIDADTKLVTLNEEEEVYADEVAGYLATKVGKIKHVDDTFQISKIDVLKKEIVTLNGKTIRFTDLGTGQSQAAYLEGLLNMNDNRIIIALLDEVAMMDNKSLEPILNKLVELYKEKKLMIALVVQKRDDKVVVKSLI